MGKRIHTSIGFITEGESRTVVEFCSGREFAVDRSSQLLIGSKRVKKESMVAHLKSTCHQRARDAKANRKDKPLEKSFQYADEKTLEKMDKLFRTAYYLVKQERPFSDFKSLLTLQQLNGIDLGQSYTNDMAAKEFASQIADDFLYKLKEALNELHCSVFCDGSTDRTESEKELIMVKLLIDHYPTMMFLRLEEPPNTKAEGIVAAIDNAFHNICVDDWKKKL